MTSLWLAGVLGIPFVLNAGIIFIAFLFSAAVGIIFGYFLPSKQPDWTRSRRSVMNDLDKGIQ